MVGINLMRRDIWADESCKHGAVFPGLSEPGPKAVVHFLGVVAPPLRLWASLPDGLPL